MVHSDRTVVVLLHKLFSSVLALSIILSALLWNVHMLIWANVTLWHMSTILSPFRYNFSSKPIVFCRFCIWIAQGGIDLHFSLILVTKANAVEGGITSAVWLFHQCNQSTHGADGMTVMSLSASLEHRISDGRDCLSQIVLTKTYHVSSMPNHVKLKIIA